jgi:site-specific DNA-methyltransferase (adenine-specific)
MGRYEYKEEKLILEINKVYNENCLNTMKRMPDNFIDLTLTSPPYDNLRTYNNEIDKSWNEEIWKPIIKELYRITKDGGVVVWVVGDATIDGSETGTSFKQALYFKEIGFNIHDTMIYLKNSLAFPDTVRYYQGFEYMFVFSKGKPKTINLISDRKNVSEGRSVHGTERKKDGTMLTRKSCHGNIIKSYGIRFNYWLLYNQKRGIESQHPAKFPEELANDHIVSWSKENDLVYDPFMGSGTTAKMSIATKRNYIGSEISEEYCKIIEKRISSVQQNLF